jgi:hypothetical protein
LNDVPLTVPHRPDIVGCPELRAVLAHDAAFIIQSFIVVIEPTHDFSPVFRIGINLRPDVTYRIHHVLRRVITDHLSKGLIHINKPACGRRSEYPYGRVHQHVQAIERNVLHGFFSCFVWLFLGHEHLLMARKNPKPTALTAKLKSVQPFCNQKE